MCFITSTISNREEDAEKRAFLLYVTTLVREQLVTTLGIVGDYGAGEDVKGS